LASATSEVRLGAFVGCAAHRNAGLLAEAVTTLDIVSHGRAMFAIGTGRFEAEHLAYGYEFGGVADRFERLVEVREIVRSTFTNEQTTHDGRYSKADDAPRSLEPSSTW
jgi:alkanesulfonate monooxygenase SsuD/methylene tetrahydromethanopterin reductase-like flavin-dependent oxidoreductase (luciferase family)